MQLWVHDGERMALASVAVAPGLYKIFDEILVNAADNKARDPRMDTLRVDIDPVRPAQRTHGKGSYAAPLPTSLRVAFYCASLARTGTLQRRRRRRMRLSKMREKVPRPAGSCEAGC